MCNHNHLDVRVNLKCLFQCHRVHIPGVTLGVDENGNAPLINHGIHRGAEGDVRAEDLFAAQRTLADHCLTVHSLSRKLYSKVERGRSRRQCDGVAHTDPFGEQPLRLVNVLPYRGHPVCLIRLGNIFHLIAVHRGR